MDNVLQVGLIADTHVPGVLPRLPASLHTALAGVDFLIHAGDLATLSVLDELEQIAPTAAVVGNCDPPEVARCLPAQTRLSLAGHRIGVRHGHQRHTLQNLYIGCSYDAPEFDLFY
jgi:putative phosphoesterase